MVFEVLRRFLIVPGGFLWFFKVPSCFFDCSRSVSGLFFMVSSGFSWLFKIPVCFFVVSCQF